MTTTKREKRTTRMLAGGAVAVLAVAAFAAYMGTWGSEAHAGGRQARGFEANANANDAAPANPPRVDVVFALDTTGSMAGLIDGAKRKVWAIANRVVSGQPRPDVRIGLVAYRDRGDEYITRVVPLTRDIDSVHEHLSGFQADGGGDGPEHVNQALADSIRKMQWDSGENVLKLIFLVGDAPPHDDYRDGMTAISLAKEAKQEGIVINAIRCGSDPYAETAWRAIASAASGRYASIAQDGGVVAVSTPFDETLRGLNVELASSMVGFGDGRRRARAARKSAARAALPPAAAAPAASYSAKADRLDSDDLVTAWKEGSIDLGGLMAAELPDEIATLDAPRQEAWLKGKDKDRKRLNAKILKVAKKREAYLFEAEAEDGAGADLGFDGQVLDMLREQAAEIGVKYAE
jgi:Mg-chelatase subunit ChlD